MVWQPSEECRRQHLYGMISRSIDVLPRGRRTELLSGDAAFGFVYLPLLAGLIFIAF